MKVMLTLVEMADLMWSWGH